MKKVKIQILNFSFHHTNAFRFYLSIYISPNRFTKSKFKVLPASKFTTPSKKKSYKTCTQKVLCISSFKDLEED